VIRRSFSVVSLGKFSRTPIGTERGDQRSRFQEHSIRVPSPGGEGQGEGGPILTAFKLS
jgi:hypothetical protein